MLLYQLQMFVVCLIAVPQLAKQSPILYGILIFTSSLTKTATFLYPDP
jgi:hypothetical protein